MRILQVAVCCDAVHTAAAAVVVLLLVLRLGLHSSSCSNRPQQQRCLLPLLLLLLLFLLLCRCCYRFHVRCGRDHLFCTSVVGSRVGGTASRRQVWYRRGYWVLGKWANKGQQYHRKQNQGNISSEKYEKPLKTELISAPSSSRN